MLLAEPSYSLAPTVASPRADFVPPRLGDRRPVAAPRHGEVRRVDQVMSDVLARYGLDANPGTALSRAESLGRIGRSA
jgi:hypothetical protein